MSLKTSALFMSIYILDLWMDGYGIHHCCSFSPSSRVKVGFETQCFIITYISRSTRRISKTTNMRGDLSVSDFSTTTIPTDFFRLWSVVSTQSDSSLPTRRRGGKGRNCPTRKWSFQKNHSLLMTHFSRPLLERWLWAILSKVPLARKAWYVLRLAGQSASIECFDHS